MTWVEGRKLDTVTVNGQTYTYVYNSDGERVKKINPDGSYIEYYVMDGITVGESHFTATGNKTLGIRYTLDENGTVVGFTMNGVNYYFAKNLQGDVLAVYNATTNELAAQYTYDSWGNILTATGNLAEINPFRYRSYYYDEETNFYYLQSRYYASEIARFVNADMFISTGQGIIGHNRFSYCLNNPIVYVDKSGFFAVIRDGAESVGATTAGLNSNVTVYAIEMEAVGGVLYSNSLPLRGEPNSTATLYNPDGTPKQVREYGPDGFPIKDTDYNHGGDHDFPHEHEWEDGERGSATPVSKQSMDHKNAGASIVVGIGAIGVGYLLYRGIRMLPSLIPPLWWTIPANVATP